MASAGRFSRFGRSPRAQGKGEASAKALAPVCTPSVAGGGALGCKSALCLTRNAGALVATAALAPDVFVKGSEAPRADAGARAIRVARRQVETVRDGVTLAHVYGVGFGRATPRPAPTAAAKDQGRTSGTGWFAMVSAMMPTSEPMKTTRAKTGTVSCTMAS